MCATDKVWITKLTLIHKNISFVPNSHAQVYTCMSICRNSHYDDVDKNNNDSSKRLDRHYHKYHSSSYRTLWDISDNICLSVCLQNCRYSIYNKCKYNLYDVTLQIHDKHTIIDMLCISYISGFAIELILLWEIHYRKANQRYYMYLSVMLLSQWTVH